MSVDKMSIKIPSDVNDTFDIFSISNTFDVSSASSYSTSGTPS
ncbi:11507_t:CDS:2 [Funneliformis mosseae]|uniref:11507_t:CDS:1 n=1 Tax=Funneliformis mosseae TaxID=27381 RepID=A0A9N9A2H6_FUNMO|nr:11507_t:CDS:2 [Funneliformis mosseae]